MKIQKLIYPKEPLQKSKWGLNIYSKENELIHSVEKI